MFNAGAAEPERGKATVVADWSEIIEGRKLVLRWRPCHRSLARPWILQTSRDGTAAVSVGFYQTVWVRDARDGTWRVLYDGLASTPQKVADRAAAEKWVAEQPMADCA